MFDTGMELSEEEAREVDGFYLALLGGEEGRRGYTGFLNLFVCPKNGENKS